MGALETPENRGWRCTTFVSAAGAAGDERDNRSAVAALRSWVRKLFMGAAKLGLQNLMTATIGGMERLPAAVIAAGAAVIATGAAKDPGMKEQVVHEWIVLACVKDSVDGYKEDSMDGEKGHLHIREEDHIFHNLGVLMMNLLRNYWG